MNRRHLLVALTCLPGLARAAAPVRLPAFPDDPARWLNSPPLTPSTLAGRPVLVEFWTFECSNCRNTQAWMDHVHGRYRPAGLIIVGIHTPELPQERDPAAVRRAVAARHIAYPVVLDRDATLWRTFDNAYWPAVYLFDRRGVLAATQIGELHVGERRGDAFERMIAGVVGFQAGADEAVSR